MDELVDFHTHKAAGFPALVSERTPRAVFSSLENHPWHLENLSDSMRAAARFENVRAIGEIGLDKCRGEAFARQVEIFEAMLKLAEEVGKPVVIHSVRAYGEVAGALARRRIVGKMLHGFCRGGEFLRQLARDGFYISISRGGIAAAGEALRRFPALLDRVGLETDGDESTPLEELYRMAAREWQVEDAELRARLAGNFYRFLNLKG